MAKKKVYQKERIYGDEWLNYIMLIPPLIGFVVFTCYPLLWAASLSFFDYDGIASHTRFIGLENILILFKDQVYWRAWVTTFEFALLKVPFEMVLALGMAIILNKKIPFRGLFRGVFYLPHVISISLMCVVIYNMFDLNGLINNTFFSMGLITNKVDWFGNKWSALSVLVMSSIWSTFGINVLYFIAALNNIPEECYEAAKIDGAGKWRQFISIQLPLMAPVVQVILLLSINGTLHTGEFVYVLTGGAPGGQTHTIMSYLLAKYTPGIGGALNLGYGCASSFVTSILMCFIALAYNKMSKSLSDIY